MQNGNEKNGNGKSGKNEKIVNGNGRPRRSPGSTVTILLIDSDEIIRLCRELKAAAKNSRYSGGCRIVTAMDAKDPARRAFLEVALGGEARRKRGLL